VSTPATNHGLNAAQREAVSTLSGPLLVLAGAGTGKTRVITFRIANLMKSGIAPHRILAMTFTNKAAREMRERALGLIGKRPRGTKPPEISTFHSLCVRVLRRHARALGYPQEFAIHDRGDQETVARSALRSVRVGDDTLRPGDFLAIVGRWKNQGLRPDQAEAIAEANKEQLAASAYAIYQRNLRASGAMDFDDLLLCTQELFEKHPEARFAEASRFDHVLVDEYQDTNDLQYRVLRALAERHKNLCVVGDDDQSIYGWRGAEVAHILGFQRDWPGAKIVRLEENYRSTAPILEHANRLILHNGSRHKKTLRSTRGAGDQPRFVRYDDETLEAEGVVREIERLIQSTGDGQRRKPSDIAVLFRTNEQPRAFELEMRRAKIPYTLVGGMSFYDRKEVRDILAYLKVVANPSDEVSLLRTINTPSRGIGPGSVEILMRRAVSEGQPLWAVLPNASSDPDLSHGVGPRIDAFRTMIEEYRARLGHSKLSEIVTELVTRIDYQGELRRLYPESSEAEGRWNAVGELLNSVAIYEERTDNPSLLGFLEEATLSGRESSKDDEKQKQAVTLMTLHSAKGLEFPLVYMVGMEEGLLPHQRSVVDGRGIEEERRLCYVGVTRAEELLTLTFAKQRTKWGKIRASIPSRFLMELKGDTARAKAAAEAAAKLFGAAQAASPEPEEPAPKKRRSKKAVAKKALPDERADAPTPPPPEIASGFEDFDPAAAPQTPEPRPQEPPDPRARAAARAAALERHAAAAAAARAALDAAHAPRPPPEPRPAHDAQRAREAARAAALARQADAARAALDAALGRDARPLAPMGQPSPAAPPSPNLSASAPVPPSSLALSASAPASAPASASASAPAPAPSTASTPSEAPDAPVTMRTPPKPTRTRSA
jgi:DNA helicase II / ATP-dependent DNA helicase PcrA